MWDRLRVFMTRGKSKDAFFLAYDSDLEDQGDRAKSRLNSPSSTPKRAGIVPSTRFPALPVEIWRRILAYVVRLPGADAVDRDNTLTPWHDSPQPDEPDRDIFRDRRRLLMVCRSWRPIVLEYMAEYLIVCCPKYLLNTVELFEKNRLQPRGPYLGDWTRRIDFQVHKGMCTGDYIASIPTLNVVRLIRCTPNLRIYINDNRRSEIRAYETHPDVVLALMTHSSQSLRRVEWNSSDERPSWSHIQRLSTALHELQTLRLSCLPWFPFPQSIDMNTIHFSHLKTLSLGPTTQISPGEGSAVLWEPFLCWLASSKDHLPQLERLEFAVTPSLVFFRVHGHKIRQLRVMYWRVPTHFPNILHLCPNLQSLSFSFKHSDGIHLPASHPSLRQICILPFAENYITVPSWIFSNAVLTHLDALLLSIERMELPQLLRVRIRNVGAFSDLIEYSVWLQMWWRRWNIRGVRFEDKAGKTFQSICTEEDRLLDTVRG